MWLRSTWQVCFLELALKGEDAILSEDEDNVGLDFLKLVCMATNK